VTTLRPRDWGGALIALAAATLFVRLGIWQVHRLSQRRARNAVIAARRALPPLVVEGRPEVAEPDALADRRVIAHGVFDYGGERLWPGRTYDGTPGVAVLTPLRLADGSAVYVDRGWVPSPDGVHIDRPAVREADTATVAGFAFATPRGRGDIDVRRLQDSVSYPLLPYVLQQSPRAGGFGRLPYRWPERALDDGPHLSYAIQWFSFAAITLVGTVALLRKAQRERESSRPTI